MRIGNTRRGVHPSIDTSTFAAWFLDETSYATINDVVRNQRDLTAVGAIAAPAVVDGVIGRAASFSGAALRGRAAAAADITFAQALTWTALAWVKLTTMPAAGTTKVILSLAGRSDQEGADDNIQLQMNIVGVANGLATVAVPSMRWEQGAGVDVVSTTSFTVGSGSITNNPFRFQIGQWVLLGWRKRDGGGGLVNLDLVVNGSTIQTFTGLVNATGGAVVTNQRWTMGGWVNTALAIQEALSAQVSGAYLWPTALTDDQCAEAYRRGVGFALPSAVHTRLFIENNQTPGVFVDVSNDVTFNGDFFEEATISDSIDQITESMNVTLTREIGELSLAPLKGDSLINNPTLAASFTPFLALWRQIRLEWARAPLWVTPVSTDWQPRFLGRIDELDDAGEQIVLSCRDQGARLIERWINADRLYPNPSVATSRELVIGQILTDNGALAALFTPEASNSVLVAKTDPAQSTPRGNLMPTIRAYAAAIGWDLNFKRFDPNSATFRLTFYDPFRVRLAPDMVLRPTEIVTTDEGSINLSQVRNRWVATFPDSTATDLNGLFVQANVFADDAASQAAYDIRESEIVEDQSSQVDTAAEAQRMVDGLIQDSSTPFRNTGKQIPLCPEISSQDNVLVLPDSIRETLPQLGAVRSFEHRFSRTGGVTSVKAEGKPAAGFNRWLSIEAGRHGRPPIRNMGEILTGRGRGSLLPGIMDMVDRSVYLGGTKFIDVKNGDFGRFTRGAAFPPDSWDMEAGVWNTGITQITATNLSGGAAIQWTTTTPQLRSQIFPINGDTNTPYSFELVWQRAGDDLPVVDVQWIAIDRTTVVATTTLTPGGAAPNFPATTVAVGTFTTSRVDGVAPPVAGTARYMRLVLRCTQVGGVFSGIIMDGVTAYRTARETRATIDGSAWGLFVVAGGIKNQSYGDVTTAGFYDRGKNLVTGGAPSGYRFLVREAGSYRIRIVMWVIGNGAGVGVKTYRCLLRLNGTYNAAAAPIAPLGTVIIQEEITQTFNIVPPTPIRVEHVVDLVEGDRLSVDLEYVAGNGNLSAAVGFVGGAVVDPSLYHVKLQLVQ